MKYEVSQAGERRQTFWIGINRWHHCQFSGVNCLIILHRTKRKNKTPHVPKFLLDLTLIAVVWGITRTFKMSTALRSLTIKTYFYVSQLKKTHPFSL